MREGLDDGSDHAVLSESLTADAPLRCAKCGGDLQVTLAESSVTCRFCGEKQPNPRPLEPGQEVLVAVRSAQALVFGDGSGRQLTRVKIANGPDRIELEDGQTARLEDLVVLARPAAGEVKARTLVWVSGKHGWYETFAADVDRAGNVRVHSQMQAFQDSFFDERVDADKVRVPFREADRKRIGFFENAWDRFRARPGDYIFQGGVTGCIGVAFLFVFGLFAWIGCEAILHH